MKSRVCWGDHASSSARISSHSRTQSTHMRTSPADATPPTSWRAFPQKLHRSRLEYLSGDSIALLGEGKQQMLGSDVAVAGVFGDLSGEDQDESRPWPHGIQRQSRGTKSLNN